MNAMRKFGPVIIAAVLVIGAVAFYVSVVRKLAAKRGSAMSDLESRRNRLKEIARQVPNPGRIDAAEEAARRENLQADRCEELLGDQARLCHTRRFFKSEEFGHTDYGKPIEGEVEWLRMYTRENERLHQMLYDANMVDWIVEENWGERLPLDEEIQEAQEMYWFQHDLAELLTDNTEAAFQHLIDTLVTGEDRFPKTPADLVINFNPSRLDELLRALPIEKLEAVLEAIVINEGQADLATIFDTYLSSEDPNEDFSWNRVLGLTMNERQRLFLAQIRPTDRPDLSYHQRFVDYVMDLRSVRYQRDVVGLLERHGFKDDLAKSMTRLTQEERERIRELIKGWNRTRLAQAIANIVSVQDEKDYSLLRDNHKMKLAEVGQVSITRPYAATTRGVEGGLGPAEMEPMRGGPGEFERGGPMRGGPMPMRGGVGRETMAAQAGSDIAKVTEFSLSIKVEFERIPIVLRRLMSTDWRYDVVVTQIQPVEGTASLSATGERLGETYRPMAGPGRAAPLTAPARTAVPRAAPYPTRRPEPRPTTPTPGRISPRTTPGAPGATMPPGPGAEPGAAPPGAEVAVVEGRQYVWVDLECRAYQYVPLMEKIKARREGASRETPAAPARPMGGTFR